MVWRRVWPGGVVSMLSMYSRMLLLWRPRATINWLPGNDRRSCDLVITESSQRRERDRERPNLISGGDGGGKGYLLGSCQSQTGLIQ